MTFRTPRRTFLTRALRAGALLSATSQPALATALTPTTAGAASIRAGSPIALHLPSVGLYAPVEPVWLAPSDASTSSQPASDRLTLDGMPVEIGLPSSPNAAGWFALGAIPGEPGDALLVGHVDTVSGPAVFTRLPSLKLGAEIVLELEGGMPATFILDSIRRHPAYLPAPAELFRLDGAPRLHLVTCTGSFVRANGGYQDRLILSASPAPLPFPEPLPEEALQSS